MKQALPLTVNICSAVCYSSSCFVRANFKQHGVIRTAYVCLIVLLLFPLSGVSQHNLSNTVAQITSDDGLSQNMVFDLLQDQKGFIWLATKDGLNRYDGYEFKIYRSDPADNKSIYGNYVTFLAEDLDGNIWVETRPGGLHLYNEMSDNFTKINQKYTIPPGFEDTFLHELFGSRETGWWAATYSGLFYINPDDLSVTKINLTEQESDISVNLIMHDKQSDMIFVGKDEKGFFKKNIHDKSGSWEPAAILNQHFDPELSVNHLLKTDNGNWLMIQESVISEISGDGTLIRKYDTDEDNSLEFPMIVSIEPLGDNLYWMVQNSELIKLDFGKKRFEVPEKLDFVHSLTVDRSGVVWAGTSGVGIYRYDPKSVRFGYTPKKFSEWVIPDLQSKIEENYRLGYQPADYQAFTIIPESNEVYWILTLSSGLIRYDSNAQEMDRHIVVLPKLGKEIYHAYWADRDQYGVFTKLFKQWVVRYHPKVGLMGYWEVSDFFPDADMSGGFPLYEPLTIVKYHKDRIWTGSSEDGLAVFHPESQTLKRFRYDPDETNSISSNHIISLAPDPKNPSQMWAGTDGGGLNRIDIETGDILRINESDGLPNDVIYAIYPDKSGNLWMSSNKGIIKLDPETFETLNFVKSDGLQSNEFNRREHMQFPDGRILFCGIGGCNLFDPDLIELNKAKPAIEITSVSVMNEEVLPLGSGWFDLDEGEPVLNVEWRQNIIGFEFAALDYSAPDKNSYYYRFPPFIEEWTDIGNRREVTFTNLDPGSYRLEVMGSNNDGIWSSRPAVMHVEVSPPFWMTAWFRVLSMLLFSGLIVGLSVYLSKLRYRRKLREIEYKMMVDQERLRISRDMHDELGSRLTQIRMMSEIAVERDDTGGNGVFRNKFSEISQEAEKVIQNFSEIVWSLNPTNDTIDSLIGYMIQYSQNYCRKINLRCRIQADPEFPDISISSEKRHNALAVFKESINNAAKHAGADKIEITMRYDSGSATIRISISDDGCGFEVNNVNKTVGQGLRSMKSRMEGIGGELLVDSVIDDGTKVSFSFPVSDHP